MSDTLSSTTDLEEETEENCKFEERERIEDKEKDSSKKSGKKGKKEEKEARQELLEFDDDLEDNEESISLPSKKNLKKVGLNEDFNEFTDEETKEEKKSKDEKESFFPLSPMSKSEGDSSFSRKRLSILQAREVAGDIAEKLDSEREKMELEKE